jgi:hypothetical protein
VRCGCFGCRLGPPGLDDDYRLGAGDVPSGAQELTHVADRLHVQDDALRVGIVAEVIEQVGEIDIGHCTDADKSTETDVLRVGPVEDRRADRPTLAEECDLAGQSHAGGKTRVQTARWALDAKAIWTNKVHSATRGWANLVFQLFPFDPEFGKAGGDNNGCLDTALRRIADHGGNRRGRRGDNG